MATASLWNCYSSHMNCKDVGLKPGLKTHRHLLTRTILRLEVLHTPTWDSNLRHEMSEFRNNTAIITKTPLSCVIAITQSI
jgi:hypothetical protein